VLTPGEGTGEAVEKGVAHYSPGQNSSIGRRSIGKALRKGKVKRERARLMSGGLDFSACNLTHQCLVGAKFKGVSRNFSAKSGPSNSGCSGLPEILGRVIRFQKLLPENVLKILGT
jgi:hypothetical protein